MHVGKPEPIVSIYAGSFGQADEKYAAEKTLLSGAGYIATELGRTVEKRALRPDITQIEVRYDYPPVADDWTGARLVNDEFEAAWNDAAEAKHLMKQLRLARKELVALKREQTGNATAARRTVRGTEAKAAVAAPHVALADRYELRIRNLDAVMRDIEGWLLDGSDD
jgi:hypothetical protein